MKTTKGHKIKRIRVKEFGRGVCQYVPCKKEFSLKRLKQRFCSANCRYSYANENNPRINSLGLTLDDLLKLHKQGVTSKQDT